MACGRSRYRLRQSSKRMLRGDGRLPRGQSAAVTCTARTGQRSGRVPKITVNRIRGRRSGDLNALERAPWVFDSGADAPVYVGFPARPRENAGNGAPERIRTSDPQIRSLVLYPAELRAPDTAAGSRPAGVKGLLEAQIRLGKTLRATTCAGRARASDFAGPTASGRSRARAPPRRGSPPACRHAATGRRAAFRTAVPPRSPGRTAG